MYSSTPSTQTEEPKHIVYLRTIRDVPCLGKNFPQLKCEVKNLRVHGRKNIHSSHPHTHSYYPTSTVVTYILLVGVTCKSNQKMDMYKLLLILFTRII